MRQFFYSLFLRWEMIPVIILILGLNPVSAQDDQLLTPVSSSYAIKGATIITTPGKKIEGGVVLIKDGLIIGVGKDLPIPAESITIKADSMFVYAGFIDGYSHAGITSPKSDKKEKVKYPGNPPPDIAGVTPERDVRDFINPKDKTIFDLRNQGFTVAQVVPHGNFLPGQAAVILLDGTEVDKMTLVPSSTFYSELSGASGVYPTTIMAVMAKWRELYKQASLSKAYEATYVLNPAGIERPESNRVLESFYPVIDKRQTVLFKSEKVIETQRVIALKNDLGFQLMIGDLKEGWPIITKIKNADAKVFLSLELPGETGKDKEKGESSDEKKDLDKRKAEAISNYTAQASNFAKAGINFGFSTNSVQPKDIRSNLRRMIAAGLSENAALASLTTTPAQLLGLSNRLGTIDNGKMANLVVTKGPYFSEKSNVKYVFVEGKLHVIEEAKSSNGKKPEIDGMWTYHTETTQGKGTGKLVIKRDNDNYTGSITNNFSGQETAIRDVLLNGSSLSFNYVIMVDGNQIKIEVSVKVSGDSFEGSMAAGQYGTFPMRGTRDPNKKF